MSRLISFFQFALITLIAFPAFAEGAAAGGGSAMNSMAAGLAIGIAAFGGSLGQGRAGAAALEGIARNPGAKGDIFVPMILVLALIESLVIYALVISFQILG